MAEIFPASRTSCYRNTRLLSSHMGASGIVIVVAGTQRRRRPGQNSGRRNSHRTLHGIRGCWRNWWRWDGESQWSGSARCENQFRLQELPLSLNDGCVVRPARSRFPDSICNSRFEVARQSMLIRPYRSQDTRSRGFPCHASHARYSGDPRFNVALATKRLRRRLIRRACVPPGPSPEPAAREPNCLVGASQHRLAGLKRDRQIGNSAAPRSSETRGADCRTLLARRMQSEERWRDRAFRRCPDGYPWRVEQSRMGAMRRAAIRARSGRQTTYTLMQPRTRNSGFVFARQQGILVAQERSVATS